MEITIGLTETDRAGDYVPYIDGYRSGAKQVEVKIHLIDEVVFNTGHHALADAIYVATNVRGEFGLPTDPLIAYVLGALGDYRQRSLSVGDTLSFDDLTFACARFGWEQV